MKRMIAALCLGAAMIPNSAFAEKLFIGSLVFISRTNCDLDLDDPQYSMFHPRLAGNEDFSGLTHMNQFGGAGYELASADFGNPFQAVDGHGLGWSGYGFSNSAIRVLTQTPATITATTPTVTLIGQIRNPYGNLGFNSLPCIGTFKAVYVTKTDPG